LRAQNHPLQRHRAASFGHAGAFVNEDTLGTMPVSSSSAERFFHSNPFGRFATANGK
jgi:hypothetical protein